EEPARLHAETVENPGTMFRRRAVFPADSVLVKTLSLETERGKPDSRRRIETQLLHYTGRQWRGYSYAWNESQTDAALVGTTGAERTIPVLDPQSPGGRREHRWRFHSRGECMICHNPWAEHAIGFQAAQLDRPVETSGATSQLAAWQSSGLLSLAGDVLKGLKPGAGRIVDPYDESKPLDERARSYLHVNCAHCHQLGAGGTADFDVRHTLPLAETKLVDKPPLQGTLGIDAARLVAPGDPYRSVLFYRMAKMGRGRMPHIGAELVDERGVRLMRDWIRQLPGRAPPSLDEPARRTFSEPAKGRDAAAALLGTTSGALWLADAIAAPEISPQRREEVVAAAMDRSEPHIRELFLRFVPDARRPKTLGATVDVQALLKLNGDAGRGRALFFSTGAQCKNCHRVGSEGSALGPDLTQIGKKYPKAQLLETILEPSKVIDAKYQAYQLLTAGGETHLGLLVERTEVAIVLRDAQDKLIRVPAADVAEFRPRAQSLMPDLMLKDLTAEQAADLLAYLESLK
ncbi:MAG: c-type cytochrome, partial [Pirellulales bacterium]